jgi:hypothetical protein
VNTRRTPKTHDTGAFYNLESWKDALLSILVILYVTTLGALVFGFGVRALWESEE